MRLRSFTFGRRFLAAAFLAAGLVSSAEARLTETEFELVKRFGQVVGRQPKKTSFEGRNFDVGTLLTFRSEQWSISALMIDGKCAQITYEKVGSWTDEQLVALLDRNGGRATFQEEKTGLGKSLRKWKQRDGTRAEFMLNKLTLTHPLHERHLEKLKAMAQAESKRPPKF